MIIINHSSKKFSRTISANILTLLNSIKEFTYFDRVRIVSAPFPIDILSTSEKAVQLRPFIKSIDYNGISTDWIVEHYFSFVEDLKQSIELFWQENSGQKTFDELLEELSAFEDYSTRTKKLFDLDDILNNEANIQAHLEENGRTFPIDWDYLEATLGGAQLTYFLRTLEARKKLWTDISLLFKARIELAQLEFNQITRLPSASIPIATLVQILDIFRFHKFIENEVDINVLESHVYLLLGIDKTSYNKARSAYLNNRKVNQLVHLVDTIQDFVEKNKRKKEK